MRVKLPISGWVKMREEVRFAGRILSVTISRQADAWYASFSIEVAYEPEVRTDASVVGVDLGITAKTHDETDALPNAVCGVKNENLTLSERFWACGSCGTSHDRDLNAARNLARYPESWAGSACGAEGAGRRPQTTVKPAA
jgi:transposase